MITKYDNTIEMKIEKAKKEEGYTCYFEKDGVKKYILSKYEPQKSAKNLINFESANRETVWILLGIGLGYTTQEILNKAGEYARIILVEPSLELLETQKPYIEEFLKDKKINIFYGDNTEELEEILKSVICNTDLGNVKMFINPVYKEYFEGYYKKIIEKIQFYLDKVHINDNTFKYFSETHLKNFLLNMQAIKHSQDIREYRDKYQNIPAVIVSAGPSLNKNIHYLKAFKGLIFTGGRTLPHVIKQGVSPHFLVSIDPGEISYDILQEAKDNEYNLICREITNDLILRHNKGKQYFVRQEHEQLSEELLGIDLPSLYMCGSVATLCLSAAQFMGCNPIIFIGQDLAHTDFKAHVENYKSYEVNRDNADTRYVEGIDGKLVPTNVELLIFLRGIEEFIQNTRDKTEYINCTEGGANIKGTKISTFKETIDKYNQAYEIDFYHKDLNQLEVQLNIDRLVEKIKIELEESKAIACKGMALSNSLKKEYTLYHAKQQHEVDKLLLELDEKVDKKLKKVNKLIKEFFMEAHLSTVSKLENKVPFQENNRQRDLRIADMSYNLYKNLYDAIDRASNILESLDTLREECRL